MMPTASASDTPSDNVWSARSACRVSLRARGGCSPPSATVPPRLGKLAMAEEVAINADLTRHSSVCT